MLYHAKIFVRFSLGINSRQPRLFHRKKRPDLISAWTDDADDGRRHQDNDIVRDDEHASRPDHEQGANQ